MSYTHLRFSETDDPDVLTAKIDKLTQLLEALMRTCLGKKHVTESDIRKEFEKVDLIAPGALSKYGFRSFYFKPEDVGYEKRILNVSREIDVCHFHGISWTEACFESLKERASQGSLVIRVALANPGTAFYNAYAEYTNLGIEATEEKSARVFDMWLEIYRSAINVGAEDLSMLIVHHNGFPSKAMYRLDNAIYVTPSPSIPRGHKFMTYECVELDAGKRSAFDAYKREIDGLMHSSAPTWSSDADA